MLGVASPRDEARRVLVDTRSGEGAQELNENAVIPRRASGLSIKRRQLLEHLRLLRGRQIAPSDFVDVARAAGVHQQRPLVRENVLEGQMDFIWSAGHFADSPDGRVCHHDIGRADAKRAKPGDELLSAMHEEEPRCPTGRPSSASKGPCAPGATPSARPCGAPSRRRWCTHETQRLRREARPRTRLGS